ncbi:hypothetical protein EDB84DRAFT_1458834 [Lactarius hengduanensis]|nr:hypothetical protein EDB85DRAFT_1885654 [Lactarius pseudohatsudake]KAH9048181.1 hypothetical protein EDB84DRAFT_1458834 [Lactarius hengduanensis]
MPLPRPPYPSFTLVMSSPQFAIYDNTRHPAHRISHLNRFHPYPRSHPSSRQERYMTTVDYRFSTPPPGSVQSMEPMVSTIVIEDTRKVESKSETSTMVAESILRRKKLKTAASRLSAVIVTIRRMYRGTTVKQAEEKLKFDLMN